MNGRDVVAVRTQAGKVTHFFGSQSFFGTRTPSAFERLAWYDEPHFLNEALSYLVAIPLLALLTWPVVAGLVWLVRRRTWLVSRIRPSAGPTRRAHTVAAAVAFSAIATWFGFGFIAVTNRAAERGAGEIFYGVPFMMRVLAWAPIALSALALILVATTIMAGDGDGGPSRACCCSRSSP